jgi:hypothetical protein
VDLGPSMDMRLRVSIQVIGSWLKKSESIIAILLSTNSMYLYIYIEPGLFFYYLSKISILLMKKTVLNAEWNVLFLSLL